MMIDKNEIVEKQGKKQHIDVMIKDMDKLSANKPNNNTSKKQNDIIVCMFILVEFTYASCMTSISIVLFWFMFVGN